MSHNTQTVIRRLPRHVTDAVRSTAHAATDLSSAACALVSNSLQARARSIQVSANVAAWSLTVEDDGCGIPAASIPLLGQRFCTSKPGTQHTGEALASLAQLSQHITVTTRAAGTFETHKKVLVAAPSHNTATSNSTGNRTNMPAATATTTTTLCAIPRQRQGTTVALSGFLHTQPVRRNRLLQQQQHRAAGSSSSALQELQQALFSLLLPHTGVELTLRQAGSSTAILHMPQNRSLESCLDQLFHQDHRQQQLPASQHSLQPRPNTNQLSSNSSSIGSSSNNNSLLQHIQGQHSQGWHVRGCVLTAPAPALATQLLYVNSAPVCCPVLSQLLRDWFAKHVKLAALAAGAGAGAGAAAGPVVLPGSTNSSRTPEPGYVLLITCPAACCSTSRQPGSSTQLAADFSDAMGPLCEALQAALAPHWGSLPSLWAKAAKTSASAAASATAVAAGTRHLPAAGVVRPRQAQGINTTSINSINSNNPLSLPEGRQLNLGSSSGGCRRGSGGTTAAAAAGLVSSMPAHGLQLASHTRSLAAVQASTSGGASAAAAAGSCPSAAAAEDLELAALLAASPPPTTRHSSGRSRRASQTAEAEAAEDQELATLLAASPPVVQRRSSGGGSSGRGRRAACTAAAVTAAEHDELAALLGSPCDDRLGHAAAAAVGSFGRAAGCSGGDSGRVSWAADTAADCQELAALLAASPDALCGSKGGGRSCGGGSRRGSLQAAATAAGCELAALLSSPCRDDHNGSGLETAWAGGASSGGGGRSGDGCSGGRAGSGPMAARRGSHRPSPAAAADDDDCALDAELAELLGEPPLGGTGSIYESRGSHPSCLPATAGFEIAAAAAACGLDAAAAAPLGGLWHQQQQQATTTLDYGLSGFGGAGGSGSGRSKRRRLSNKQGSGGGLPAWLAATADDDDSVAAAAEATAAECDAIEQEQTPTKAWLQQQQAEACSPMSAWLQQQEQQQQQEQVSPLPLPAGTAASPISMWLLQQQEQQQVQQQQEAEAVSPMSVWLQEQEAQGQQQHQEHASPTALWLQEQELKQQHREQQRSPSISELLLQQQQQQLFPQGSTGLSEFLSPAGGADSSAAGSCVGCEGQGAVEEAAADGEAVGQAEAAAVVDSGEGTVQPPGGVVQRAAAGSAAAGSVAQGAAAGSAAAADGAAGEGHQQQKQQQQKLVQTRLPFRTINGDLPRLPAAAAAAAAASGGKGKAGGKQQLPAGPLIPAWKAQQVQQQEQQQPKTAPARGTNVRNTPGASASAAPVTSSAAPAAAAPAAGGGAAASPRAVHEAASLLNPAPKAAARGTSQPAAQQQQQPVAADAVVVTPVTAAAASGKTRKRVRFSGIAADTHAGSDTGNSSNTANNSRSSSSSSRSRFFPAATAATAGAGAHGGVTALLPRRSGSLAALTANGRSSSGIAAGVSSNGGPAILTLDELCQSVGCSSLLVPGSVSRQQLQASAVVGQAANKVVVVRSGPVLLAVDQHAADERVQLERLQQQLAAQMMAAAAAAGSDDATPQQQQLLLQHQALQPHQHMSISLQESRALLLHRQQVEAWGWRVGVGGGSGASGGAVTGASQPALLQQVPELAGVRLGAVDLQLYLHQLLETGGSSSSSSGGQPPPGVLRVLRSKACRGAVMFGDALSQQQCEELLRQLAATELCFICAHGRPTTVALVDLQQLAARMRQWEARRSIVAGVAAGGGGDAQRLGDQLRRAVFLGLLV